MQFFALFLIFIGEFLAVTSEVLFIKGKNTFPLIVLMCIAGIFLLYGYYLGYKYMQNLWLIYIVSITAILILEPFIIYYFTGETPNLGSKIGFSLGTLGFLAAIFIK
ncbi:TPA: hypothetical protein DCZ36_01015 [Candidatus Gracilibacteria bacterium]|nr:hypothetical protein [Candidatus Gracilibacteria bacterium]